MEKMEKIKNIVFDLGGVLVGLDSNKCIRAFHEIGAHDIAHYVEEHKVEDLFLDQELGRITTDGFCDEVRRITSCSATDDRICWAWNELLTGIPDEKKAMLKSLAGKYRLFILSNTNDIHWDKCMDDYFAYGDEDASGYFDKVFLSCLMHVAKPSTEIFSRILEEGEMKAEETLFIDDSEANCKAAAMLGIETFHETTGKEWLTKIK